MTTARCVDGFYRRKPPTAPDATERLLRQWSVWMRAEGCSEGSTIPARLTMVRRLSASAGRGAEAVEATDVLEFLAQFDGRSTKASYFACLRAWFKWLVRAGHRIDDPTAGLKPPRVPRTEPRPVADQHMAALLDGERFYGRTRVMILLAALAGLRVHEIAKIRGEDVDLVAGTLKVTGKGGVTAVLPMHPQLLEAAESMPRWGWWFPARGGRDGHVLARSVTDVVRLAMRRAGVPGSAHALRHWFGTTLVDSGTDLRTTQTLLRHSSLQTTQIYTRVSSKNQRAAVDALDLRRGR